VLLERVWREPRKKKLTIMLCRAFSGEGRATWVNEDYCKMILALAERWWPRGSRTSLWLPEAPSNSPILVMNEGDETPWGAVMPMEAPDSQPAWWIGTRDQMMKFLRRKIAGEEHAVDGD
jgi:hypothetical protein